ncbi:unnamed protein product [Spirodela intermedia]|uniref:CCHC-type domain-containing protein n=1 Tax=Spirodela intermedia TaxID=51605 RepID=A0A7I8J8H4_SPIIN|nr:unnamed protein product [Spirodela intermedia]CAA6666526.1 unnamed protein product [Spirodela intermedia]
MNRKVSYRADPSQREELDRRIEHQPRDQERYPSPPHRDFGGDNRADRLDDRDKRREDHRARILKSVRADVVVFDGSREPKDFIDWESSMNSYFQWYRMDDDLCIFWENESYVAHRRGPPIISWDSRVVLGIFTHELSLRLQNEVLKSNLSEVDEAYRIVEHMERPAEDTQFTPPPITTKIASTRSTQTPMTTPTSTSVGNGRTTPATSVGSAPPPRSPPADASDRATVASQAHITCFKCKGKGHRMSQCPSLNLLIEIEELGSSSHEEDVPVGDDLDTTAAREITPAPGTTMLTSLPTTDDPLRTSIFYTYVKINGHTCKVIVDSSSCVNDVSDQVLQRAGLSTISHPAPYDCQVPLRVSTYDEYILCDVLLMKIGGIILGRPWLFDYDVQLMGRANTCSFMYRDRRLVWYPHTNKPTLKRDPKSHIGLIGILSEYIDVLLEELPRELTPFRHIQHAIDLVPEASLLNLPHYRMEPAKYEELRTHPTEPKSLCRACIISAKEGWHLGVCCNSCTINRITVKYRFPIPQLQDLFDMMTEKTAFKIKEGLYEWRVMPFGLSNVLRPFIGKFAVVYFDDILVYNVFETLQQEKLYAHPKKCSFFTSEVTFLGFVVSERRVSADPKKVRAIVTWPQPGSMHDIRSFIGLATFYRYFIRDFSSVIAPLTDCLKKETFLWTEVVEQAFDRVKALITQAPILRLPDFGKVFKVACDTSGVGIGGVFSQEGHPIEYFSEKLNDVRRRYSTYDRGFYAVIQALKRWRHYLLYKEFVLFSDHEALKYLHS